MGWWADLWQNIKDFVRDFVLAIIQTLAWFFDEIRINWVIFKHKTKLAIAGWIAEGDNLIIAVLGIIAATIVAIKVVPIILKSAWYLKVVAFIEAIKTGVGTVLAYAQYSVFLTVHQVSLVVFPEYRKLIQGFYAVLSALAAELAQDAMFLNLTFRGARGVVVSSYMLLGQEMPVAEVAFLDDMDAWMQNFESRFNRYARDPEQIFIDIDKEIVGPAVLQGSDGIAKLYTDVSTITTNIQDFITRVDGVRTSIDDLIETLPEEIQAVVGPKWQAMTEKYDGFMNEYIRPNIEMLTDSIDLIDGAIDRNEKKIADLEAEAKRLEALATWTDITGLIAYEADLAKIGQQFDRIYDILNYQPAELPYLKLEEKPHMPPEDVQVEQRDTPFVGDY